MKNSKESNKGLGNVFMIVGIIFLVAIGSLFTIYKAVNATGNVISSDYTNSNLANSNVQVVKLSVEGSKYLLEPSQVKAGIPVRLVGDISKLPGCSRSISISEFGVRKTFSKEGDYVDFTPNKAGTFYIACSMNMYKGTFEVANSDGTKSNYKQSAPIGGHTCGGAGGGCGGCGG